MGNPGTWLSAALVLFASVAYFVQRERGGLAREDLLLAGGIGLFTATCCFEGDVFWEPTWNLCLKIAAYGFILVAVIIESLKRRRMTNEQECQEKRSGGSPQRDD